jgi:hypothetical protein
MHPRGASYDGLRGFDAARSSVLAREILRTMLLCLWPLLIASGLARTPAVNRLCDSCDGGRG